MLSIPLKNSQSVDLRTALQRYIQRNYGRRAKRDQDRACGSVQQMRDDVRELRAGNEAAVTAIREYLGQMETLAPKFPVGRNDMRVAFAWSDTFQWTIRATGQQSWEYERSNLLFDLASVESIMGCSQNLTTKEGIKAAAKHFAAAAGILHYIRDTCLPKLLGQLPVDLSTGALNMYANLMLAQTQACYYMMGCQAGMPGPALARLAIDTADLYRAAKTAVPDTQLAKASAAVRIPWKDHFDFQAACFDASANDKQGTFLGQSVEENLGEGVGVVIAYLDYAIRAVSTGLTIAAQANAQNPNVPIETGTALGLQQGIRERLDRFRRDNQAVYLQGIPPYAEIPQLTGQRMAKPTPFDLRTFVRAGRGAGAAGGAGDAAAAGGGAAVGDLFADLVPKAVSEAVDKVMDRLKAENTGLKERSREAAEMARRRLNDAGLPGSVDAGESADGIPTPLWDKVQAVQIRGGLAELRKQLAANQSFARQSKEMMDAVAQTLRADADDDAAQRQRWGARWTAHQHIDLAKPMWDTLNRLAALHQQGSASDATMEQKVAAATDVVGRLEGSRGDLERSVPSIGAGARGGDAEREALKAGLVEVERLLREREEAANDLDNSLPKGAVAAHLMQLHSSSGGKLPEDAEDRAIASVAEDVAAARSAVQERIDAQDALLERIMLLDSRFRDTRGQDSATQARAAALQTLKEGIDKFEELQGRLKEGSAFYDSLMEQVRKLQNKASGFRYARELERNELSLQLGGGAPPPRGNPAQAVPPPPAGGGGGYPTM